MNLDMKSQVLCFGEDDPRLLRGKHSRLDKHVTELGEVAVRDYGQVLHDALNECIAMIAKFCRQCMRSKISRHDFEFRFGAHRFEHSNLGFEIQAIPALGLDRRRAMFEKTIGKTNPEVLFASNRLNAR